MQKRLAFSSKGSIGIVVRRGAASAREPTAPSALTDPGLVLVRVIVRAYGDERKRWIMSIKLTDAQLVMMSAAAQRKDRCLSAPTTVRGAALGKVSVKLATLGLVREIRRNLERRSGVGMTLDKVTRSN